MPYDNNFIVPIPKGSILAKNGNKTYVYHYTNLNSLIDKKLISKDGKAKATYYYKN